MGLDCAPVLVVLELLGGLASLLVARALRRVGRSIGAPGLSLASAGMAVLGAALLLELAGNALSLAGASGGHGRRPASVELLLANRGVLLASPLYVAAYTLYAASLYLEHVPVRRGLALAAPLMLEVYVDNNIVSLAILVYAGYLVATRGRAGPVWAVFVSLLGASHALLAVAGLRVSGGLMALGLCLRATAPIVLGAWLLVEGRRA